MPLLPRPVGQYPLADSGIGRIDVRLDGAVQVLDVIGVKGLEFDGGDSAFAFGDDDFSSASQSGSTSRASATAHTVAILAGAPAQSDDEFAIGGDTDPELATPIFSSHPFPTDGKDGAPTFSDAPAF